MNLKKLNWLFISAFVLVLDQWTKLIALKYLDMYIARPIMPFLNFTLAYNTGAAFSFLDAASGWQRWLFIGIALSVAVLALIWLLRSHNNEHLLPVALALIMGGAVSNVLDRIRLGSVVDFIDVYVKTWHWPAFNVADSAICIGVFILLLLMFFEPD
ncbi:MAG: signal peptidase II [Pseudomonadota bacterium]